MISPRLVAALRARKIDDVDERADRRPPTAKAVVIRSSCWPSAADQGAGQDRRGDEEAGASGRRRRRASGRTIVQRGIGFVRMWTAVPSSSSAPSAAVPKTSATSGITLETRRPSRDGSRRFGRGPRVADPEERPEDHRRPGDEEHQQRPPPPERGRGPSRSRSRASPTSRLIGGSPGTRRRSRASRPSGRPRRAGRRRRARPGRRSG